MKQKYPYLKALMFVLFPVLNFVITVITQQYIHICGIKWQDHVYIDFLWLISVIPEYLRVDSDLVPRVLD